MVHHPNISSPTSQVKVKLIFIVMSMLIEPSSISIVHRVCRFVGGARLSAASRPGKGK